MIKKFVVFALLLALMVPTKPGFAQSGDLPVYYIQPGDTLNMVALRFGVSPQDLIDTNQILDPNILSAGTPLKIPGLIGITGELTTEPAALGDSYRSLTRKHQIPEELFSRINRITSPNEVYVGSTLVLTRNDVAATNQISALNLGDTLLESAILSNSNPWKVALSNFNPNPVSLIPLEPIAASTRLTSLQSSDHPAITEISMSQLPLIQGKTEVIRIQTTGPLILSGTLNGKNLQFFSISENEQIAIQGIHAMSKPGLAEFSLAARLPDQEASLLEINQAVLLESGYYPNDVALVVDPQTIDKSVTEPEEELIRSIVSQINPQKYWSGIFIQPVDEPSCIKSWFGNRRSYNGGPYEYFHTGVDYGVCANLNIYAPAGGVVVFAGELTVRGNATIIDHGWGVFSGIWHQQKINVSVGEVVEAGQLIGEIGGTGRATGPHLHWEIWANQIQVEPLDWLEVEFP